MSSHEKLLDRWRSLPHHLGQGFISDGIIDPSKWTLAPCKVLFFLKEAYGDDGPPQDWDLRLKIRDEWRGPKYKTWWTVSYWAYAVHRLAAGQAAPFPNSDPEYGLCREALLSSATINIKKSMGRSSSDLDELDYYAAKDGTLLREQTELIAPDLVICGYTWEILRKHCWPEAEQVHDLIWRAGDLTFIDFWHPANQYPDRLCYYALAALAGKVIK